MTWRVHITWRQPAPPGRYDGTPMLDYARTLAGFDTREEAWEAGRKIAMTLTDADFHVTEQPTGRA